MCVFVLLPNHKVAFKNGSLLLADEVSWLDVQLPGAAKYMAPLQLGNSGLQWGSRRLVGGSGMCHLDQQGPSVGRALKPTSWPQGCQMGL